MIQEEDINKPTAQAIQGVWKMLLEETSGVTLDGFERPKGALLGMMQYPVSSKGIRRRKGRRREGRKGAKGRRTERLARRDGSSPFRSLSFTEEVDGMLWCMVVARAV